MLMIKLMSGEDAADSSPSKSFTAVVVGAGQTFEFYRKEQQPYLDVIGNDETITYPLLGNAYVVSEMGKTIATFAHADVKFSSTPPALPERPKPSALKDEASQ